MTQKSYTGTIATALRLITKFGGPVTYIQYDTELADAAKPWDGPTNELDPDDAGTFRATLQTVFVPPAKVRAYGITTLASDYDIQGLANLYDRIGIVAPEGNEMSRFSAAMIDGVLFGLDRLSVLQPRDEPILAFVGIKR